MKKPEYSFRYDVRLNFKNVDQKELSDLMTKVLSSLNPVFFSVYRTENEHEYEVAALIDDLTLKEAALLSTEYASSSFELFKKEV